MTVPDADEILRGAHTGIDPDHAATVLAACQARYSGDDLTLMCDYLGIGGES